MWMDGYVDGGIDIFHPSDVCDIDVTEALELYVNSFMSCASVT